MKALRLGTVPAVALAAWLASAPVAAQVPADAVALSFVPYAAAFSLETRQSELVDPLVFVLAPHAPPGTGLLGIAHLPGIRNARMTDDPMQPALDANGKPLGFDLQHWFAATGVAELGGDPGGRDRVTARFTNLIANGRYSLFLSHGPGFAPLDGSARANSFTAAPDGTGAIAVIAPAPLAHGATLQLVFHSDRTDHAQQRGEIGIYAHVQLTATIP